MSARPYIVATVMVWNEAENLKRLLPTLAGRVDAVACVDGLYASAARPGDEVASVDASEDVARAFGAYWKPAPAEAYSNEVAGRNASLNLARDIARTRAGSRAAWAFYIDADETVARWDTLRLFYQMQVARALRPAYTGRDGKEHACRVRLFPLTPRACFGTAHYDVVSDNGDHLDTFAEKTDAVEIRHWPRVSADREARANEWYANRHGKGCR